MRFFFVRSQEKKHTVAKLCRALEVSRQGYYKWLNSMQRPKKLNVLLDKIRAIIGEDEFNIMYGVQRMFEALKENGESVSKSTVQRAMRAGGLIKPVKRKPNGITKADKNAQKSDDLLKRNFKSDEPCRKYVTDITEYACSDGKLYVSALFDCFDNTCSAVSIADNMERWLPINMLKSAAGRYDLRGAIVHSDRGSQYTSADYRKELEKFGIQQSMNGASGRCHDNAKCESMWGRAKVEILSLHNITRMTKEEATAVIFRYHMAYWNTKRICSAIGGTTPAKKRSRYYEKLKAA